ncbi:helix-turn-helix domain-containing protein [Mycolicibacterium sp. Dal123E01]|uniref:helix-turn-helix domain-containing protein n=1 Tax=Mycolicibacterium sp. Dal123E01 TaxID=3457578 RepID=UPI00403EBFB4
MTALGALTKASLGQTDRVAAAVAKASASVALPEPITNLPANESVGLTVEQARQLTDEIKVDAGALWTKLARAYTERAWAALDYASWDAYCAGEFQSLRLRLPLEERQEVVRSLRDAGLSIRAIASGTGSSDQTVQRDLKAGVVNHYTSRDASGEPIDAEVVEERPDEHSEHATITGMDGKAHPRRKPMSDPGTKPARQQSPLDLSFDDATKSFQKAARGLLADADRLSGYAREDEEWFRTWFTKSNKRVETVRADITKAITALEELRDLLP